MAIELFVGGLDGREVRAIGEDVGGFGVVEPVVAVMHQPAVGDERHVRHVAEGAPGVLDEVVEGFELFDQPDGGGEDAEGFEGFGRFGNVVIAAVADADLFPVSVEVEDGIDGAGDGGPDHIDRTW